MMVHHTERAGVEAAIEHAGRNADAGQFPFGAVVTIDGTVVGIGVNRVLGTGDPTAHAEVEAIRAAAEVLGPDGLAGATLASSCQPCAMCATAAINGGVDRIHYAASVTVASRRGFAPSPRMAAAMMALAGSDLRLARHVPTSRVEEPFDRWDRHLDPRRSSHRAPWEAGGR